jgi:ribosomal protein S18 acetylase RimI-like enzyme
VSVEISEIKDTGELLLIRNLALRIWPPTFEKILSEEQITYMLDRMYSMASLEKQFENGHKFLLLSENEQPIGFLAYELNYAELSQIKIHKLYLIPELQGKGYGKKLLKHAENLAQVNTQLSMVLNVNKYNPAIEFYKNYGFEIIAEEVIDIGAGFIMDDYQMKKTL